jgi:Ca-activated chloride channel family protein
MNSTVRWIAVVSWLAGSGIATAQQPQQLQQAQQPQQPQHQHEGRIQFAVKVETVNLDVVVTDHRGRFVPGLKAENFEVRENGQLQDIQFFTAQFTPVTTLLLLDSSSSIRSSLSAIQTAAYLFASNLSEGDLARVGLFSDTVRFGPRFTDDLHEHFAILRSMTAAGKTALYDAILEALGELEKVEGRKSLLIFTDGDDAGPAHQGSRATLEETIEGGRRSQATIYTIGFTGWGPDGSDSVNRPFLSTLAEASGGRAFFPEDVDQVKDAFAEVQEDLHRHYRMAYVPSNPVDDDNEWRPIIVTLKGRQDLTVRTRQGYYSHTDASP